MTLNSTENRHQKHTKLAKPSLGSFGRNELALMGSPCGKIKQLAWQIIDSLAHHLNVAFVDADHKAAEMEGAPGLHQGATLVFTDKISFRRLDYLEDANSYQVKKYFNSCDMVVVNGNHFKAAHQILIIDPKKPLDRKLDRITDPILVILSAEATDIPEYLTKQTKGLPVLKWQDTEAIIQFINDWIAARMPKLKGLVLAGGESQRMEQDKGAIKYHGTSQRSHLYHQLKALGVESLVSCREDQLPYLESELPKLSDTFHGLGPMGALLSAFRSDPNSAWLAVACDLPFLKEETIRYLIDSRDPSKMATAFQSPFDEFPEPLITIWEPKSYMNLLYFLNQGYSCPRKVLINTDIALIQPPDPKDLSNINHPHEYQEVWRELNN